MDYGNIEKLDKLLKLTESMAPTVTETRYAPNIPGKPMFPHLVESSEGIDDSELGDESNGIIDEGLLGELDSLINEVNDSLTENTSDITPAPKPAVSHKEFVANALKAKSAGSFDVAKKQDLGKQTKAGLNESSDKSDDMSDINVRAEQFKQFIAENLSTEDNKHLIEAVNNVFDIIVLKKLI